MMAEAGVYLLTSLVVAELITRHVLGFSIPFSIEYSEYLVAVVGVGGAAYTLSRGGHVRVDLVFNALSQKLKYCLVLMSLGVGLIFSMILAVTAFKMAFHNIKTGAVVMYPTQTPLGYPQLILGIGFLLLTLQVLVEIGKRIKSLFFKS
jgi:TRAP-type C4-dicarboxylate transport system permease small subunit